MKDTLPVSLRGAYTSLSQYLQKAQGLFGSKKAALRQAALVGLILVTAVLTNGNQTHQDQKQLMSPVATSLNTFSGTAQKVTTPENFAFVPDLARNKFPHIDMEGLTNLSFFDVPLDESGKLNYNSRGYASFTSEEAKELFGRARLQNTKVFLTISALDGGIIGNLLDNPEAQQKLADQIVEEIKYSGLNGIAIDFEYPRGEGRDYQNKFTEFIKLLNDNVQRETPEAQVAVAVPSKLTKDESLYNMEALGRVSDKIFLIASNFIVPETTNTAASNPVYGYNESEYFSGISNLLNNLKSKIPADKLVMERAWYGNGNNYPLYRPDSQPAEEQSLEEASSVHIDKDALERLVDGVPGKGKEEARKNIPLIAKALDVEGILDSNVLAYALATIEHETDETFAPIEEIQGAINARRLGYEGGENYFGRGFIQITHLRNYKEIGKRIGLGDRLVKNPDLATSPEIAAKILAAFFKDNNVANLASQGNFVSARTPINPDYNGYSIANLAMKYNI